ncbi:hypothetical protein Dsin_021979 [Dipteronia sinensis]|uniref:Uncharacterized protein n=1 Tax=Dipteronia sinensis TaxID=43782 RepID=A0AAE0DZM5_9ROSI|nr:hypothetical protein Dsin_021979 [Dipteronia sinensis]
MLNYDGDSEKDDDKDDDDGEAGEGEGRRDNYGQVPIVDEDVDDVNDGNDDIIRCDHVTNNMAEASNSMLGSHRVASYLELLEFIRRMIMRKFQERKKECEAWNSVLPPRVNAKILKHGKESRLFTIIATGNGEYGLLSPTGGYGVKLREYSCQYGYWQMSGSLYSCNGCHKPLLW